jgi:hypothetical protein
MIVCTKYILFNFDFLQPPPLGEPCQHSRNIGGHGHCGTPCLFLDVSFAGTYPHMARSCIIVPLSTEFILSSFNRVVLVMDTLCVFCGVGSVRHMHVNVLLRTEEGNVAATHWTCVLRYLFKCTRLVF